MEYKSLGLRIGLEVHQQLSSGRKLFCRCPVPDTTSEKIDESFVGIRRKLRPVSGETGITDIAAMHESLKNKTFIYNANPSTSCLVELDEQPPKPMNMLALNTTLQICKLLECKILDEIHVMRKTVIDGSAVSGFQRTAFIGTNGFLNTSLGKVDVQSISLEEDSAVPVDKSAEHTSYRLDRMGIPLIEIATSSDIKSPEHAKEVALEIGLLLRSTDVVRGIGSVRQDINISIERGARVEIKGFQDLDVISDVIENEVKRQLALLEVRDELLLRGAQPFKTDLRFVTHLFHDTKCEFIRKAVEHGKVIIAGRLPMFGGLLKKECGNKTLGRELSEYSGLGITHSDEDLNKYSLRPEFESLKSEFGSGERDVVFIIASDNPINSANAVFERANQCFVGVPEETRVADGIGSRYTRPLPGSGRMYPESDIQPIRLEGSYIGSLKVPKTLSQRRKELSSMMPEELASQIVKSHHFRDFERLMHYDPVIAATIFLSYFKDMSRRGLSPEAIQLEDLERILLSVKEGATPKDAVLGILERLASGENVVKVLSSYSAVSDVEIKSQIKEAVAGNLGKKESVIMGIVMQKLRGRVPGERVMQFIKEELSGRF